jgi:hypothetical protein
VALSRKSGQTISAFGNRLSDQLADWLQFIPELRCALGLIKVPKNEAEKHFAAGGALIFYFGRIGNNPRRFEARDGLLYAVVHCQALLR